MRRLHNSTIKYAGLWGAIFGFIILSGNAFGYYLKVRGGGWEPDWIGIPAIIGYLLLGFGLLLFVFIGDDKSKTPLSDSEKNWLDTEEDE